MKQLIIKISLLFCVGLSLGFTCIDEVMFKTQKVCNTSISINSLFERNNQHVLQEYLCADKVVKSTVITHCNKDVKKVLRGDTLINGYDAYLDIQYQEKYADAAYFQLLSYCQEPNTKNRLFGFFKPGKMVCLDRSNKRLRIISFNTCSDMPRLDNMIACIKNSHGFDKAFAVRCGAYDGLVEIR